MTLKLGALDVSALKLGALNVTALKLGTVTVWPPAATNAVRFDAAADKLSRSSAGLGGAFTVAGWYLLDVDRNAYSTLWSIDNGSGYTQLVTNTDGTSVYWPSSGGANTPALSFTVGVWYFVACSFAGTGATDTMYWAATGAGALSSQAADLSPGNDAWTFALGNSGFTEFLNGRVAQVKVWSAALNAGEVNAEWHSGPPVRTANLWGYYPLNGAADVNDASGNGRHLTAAGTLGTGTGPTIPP